MKPFHDKPLKYLAQPINWFAPFSLILWNHIQSHTYEYTTTLFALVSNYLIINETTFSHNSYEKYMRIIHRPLFLNGVLSNKSKCYK